MFFIPCVSSPRGWDLEHQLDKLPWCEHGDSDGVQAFGMPLSDSELDRVLAQSPADWMDLLIAQDAGSGADSQPSTHSIDMREKLVKTSSTPPKRKRRKRTYMYQEIEALRLTVVELEEQVDARRRNGHEVTQELIHDVRLLQSVWKDVTVRQQEQRAIAEKENARLRKVLKDMTEVAEHFERVLRSYRSKELTTAPLPLTNRPRQGDLRILDSGTIVDELVASIFQMYSQVDLVFCEPRFLTESVTPLRQIQAHTEGSEAVDILESRRLPFQYKQTAEALWKISEHRHHNFSWTIHNEDVVKVTDNMMVKSFEGVTDYPRQRSEYCAKMVQRRFEESDRTVVVTYMLTEPSEISMQSVRGLLIGYRHWQVIKQGPAGSTLMQAFHRTTPEFVDSAPNQRSLLREITSIVLEAIEVLLDKDIRQLENTLLQSTLPACT